jgi:hypothetical protein
MSYNTIHQNATDVPFNNRLTAAAAQEGADVPEAAANQMRWQVAAKSDIESAFASAVAAGNPNPGGDESVITDGMILAAVQSLTPPP